jgi:hypothetical protein
MQYPTEEERRIRESLQRAAAQPEPNLGFWDGANATYEQIVTGGSTQSFRNLVVDPISKSLARYEQVTGEKPPAYGPFMDTFEAINALEWMNSRSDTFARLKSDNQVGPSLANDPHFLTADEIKDTARNQILEANAKAARAGVGGMIAGSIAGMGAEPLNVVLLPAAMVAAEGVIATAAIEAATGAGIQAGIEYGSLVGKEQLGLAPSQAEINRSIQFAGVLSGVMGGAAKGFAKFGIPAMRKARILEAIDKTEAKGEYVAPDNVRNAAQTLQDYVETVPEDLAPAASDAHLSMVHEATQFLTEEDAALRARNIEKMHQWHDQMWRAQQEELIASSSEETQQAIARAQQFGDEIKKAQEITKSRLNGLEKQLREERSPNRPVSDKWLKENASPWIKSVNRDAEEVVITTNKNGITIRIHENQKLGVKPLPKVQQTDKIFGTRTVTPSPAVGRWFDIVIPKNTPLQKAKSIIEEAVSGRVHENSLVRLSRNVPAGTELPAWSRAEAGREIIRMPLSAKEKLLERQARLLKQAEYEAKLLEDHNKLMAQRSGDMILDANGVPFKKKAHAEAWAKSRGIEGFDVVETQIDPIKGKGRGFAIRPHDPGHLPGIQADLAAYGMRHGEWAEQAAAKAASEPPLPPVEKYEVRTDTPELDAEGARELDEVVGEAEKILQEMPDVTVKVMVDGVEVDRPFREVYDEILNESGDLEEIANCLISAGEK